MSRNNGYNADFGKHKHRASPSGVDWKRINHVYFLGIGGIGMSALARWFHAKGYAVAGYDKTPTALTDQLVAEGIDIHFEDNIQLIPDAIKVQKDASIIVYTPAIPKDLAEYQFLIREDFTLLKRAEVLGGLSAEQLTIAVAGTHGKTTVSSMIAHVLKHSGIDCNAFVGGIMTNYNTNVLVGAYDDLLVVEADEYDRSFLTLRPLVAVITAVSADHLDVYGSEKALQETFLAFIKNIKPKGYLFIEEKAAEILALPSDLPCHVYTYGVHEGSIRAVNLQVKSGVSHFGCHGLNHSLSDFALTLPGEYNVSNALAAIVVTYPLTHNDAQRTIAGINTYKGVKRRFEYILKTDELVYIDDYAHHPEEVQVLLEAVKALYPDLSVTVIFQPHLFSRTQDFAQGFADSLSLADEVLLLDIYPAREKPIPGVTSQIIQDKITTRVKAFRQADVLDYFDDHAPEVLLTVGAGDIGTLVLPLKEKLTGKKKI